MNAGKAGGRPSERRAEDIGLISSAEDDWELGGTATYRKKFYLFIELIEASWSIERGGREVPVWTGQDWKVDSK